MHVFQRLWHLQDDRVGRSGSVIAKINRHALRNRGCAGAICTRFHIACFQPQIVFVDSAVAGRRIRLTWFFLKADRRDIFAHFDPLACEVCIAIPIDDGVGEPVRNICCFVVGDIAVCLIGPTAI